MKVKFGAIVVAGRNKIGGHVASANRGGAYFRTKVTPINPRTSFQNTVRARLTSLSQAWRGLTDVQREGWNAAVSQFSRTDIFGDIRNPSGVNLYQRLNNNLLAVGEAAIDDVPAVAEVEVVDLIGITAVRLPQALSIDLSAAVPATSKVKVFATPSLSPGINFVSSEYRQIGFLDVDSPTPVDLLALYTARFGDLVQNQKVFVAIEFVNIDTGQTSTRQSISTIVT